MPPEPRPLPIDAVLAPIVERVLANQNVVVVAEPGAGKTTRVPRAISDALRARAGGDRADVLVLEPRRLAARLSAERVAEEVGSRLGERVGFVTRHERAVSKLTEIYYLTEGILGRRLLSDPRLAGVAAVVLDEFHERHLVSDVAIALLKRLRATSRPDLRLVVMSATLDAERVANFLDAEIVASSGRVFPVEIEHAPRQDDRQLDSRVASAVFNLCARGPNRALDGDVLVFLPGAREIRHAQTTLAKLAAEHDLFVVPLHGSLSPREQDVAVRPASRRKIILSTNVAETSVTIDGVVAVIDSGLVNQASCSPWTGLPTLKLTKISRASAAQRAGRAGRTRPGRCVRLYTAGDHDARPAFDPPEIFRMDLAEPRMELLAQGVVDARAFEWLEAPPAAALDAANELLARLGAVEPGAGLTPLGRHMLSLPIHPRLARLVVEAERRGVARDGCEIAALLAERPYGRASAADARAAGSARSDVLAILDELETSSFTSPAERMKGDATRRTAEQLQRALRISDGDRAGTTAALGPAAHEDALLISILAGYPDRVARLRAPDARAGRAARELVFAAGGSALLSEGSRVGTAGLVVAVDVEDRVEAGRSRPAVRLASSIEEDWLLELFMDRVRDEETLRISSSGRVELSRTLRFDALVLEEKIVPCTDPARAADVLAERIVADGLPLAWREVLERLATRIELVRGRAPRFGTPATDPTELASVARAAAEGQLTLSGALEANPASLVEAALTPEQRRLLRELAPERVELPSGRSLLVAYRPGVSPSVASRLQDFFGMAEGPKILGGATPLLLELLAPNQRAVQVTTDLAGFWQRHYPAIARELRRKYPRHAWPDNPATAQPPAPRAARPPR